MNEILAEILAVFQDFKPSAEVCGSALRYAALIVFSSVLLRIFEERLTARIQMRPPRKAFAFFRGTRQSVFQRAFRSVQRAKSRLSVRSRVCVGDGGVFLLFPVGRFGL